MVRVEKLTNTDVKKINKNRIFRLIHYAGKISRQDIAEVLQLSLPTVNQNLKMLTEENLINFGGSFESTGGRKAQVITINSKTKYAVSVNISVRNVTVTLVNLNGKIVDFVKDRIAFVDDDSYGQAIAKMIDYILKFNGIDEALVLGVGITVPGIFDSDGKVIVSAPTMRIRNYPVNRITDFIPFECRAMNDARANAYAEYWFDGRCDNEKVSLEEFNNSMVSGLAEGKIYLMLNHGVGGSYIDNERMRKGKHNCYGEFGHMTIHPGGKQCFCGKKGCFESYVSSRCLSTELGIELDEFFEGLKDGNILYKDVFETYIDDLTTGINNLYIISDSDVVVGGPVARYLEKYEDDIRALLIKKYSFDTDGSYFSFARCTSEQADTGAALTFLGDYISSV